MQPVRILLWHGWLLEGTGSNIYTAKVAEAWRAAGHDVVLVCQQRHPERFSFFDAWTTAGTDGVAPLQATGADPAAGSAILVCPDIGSLLPVFVEDEYEGFTVKTFVDLTEEELARYLERNVAALSAVVAWRPPDAVVAGHVVAGPVIALRALGHGGYVAKVHGSDIEYAVKQQERYAVLAREGLEPARAVSGASRDVLARAVAVAPSIADRIRVVPPGVDLDRWRPRPRSEALGEAAARLDRDPDTATGRPPDVDARVRALLAARDGPGLDALARSYDQAVPDPEAADRLRRLADLRGPVVAYLGKLIPQKGVERFIEALAVLGPEVRGMVVGFGLFREWYVALTAALDAGDEAAHAWLGETSPMRLELGPGEVAAARGLGSRLVFTGRLDHRYAPEAVAAADVLVVPSTLEEAFGMVAAEAAAAGALPLVARHSSLAEVADALEGAIGRPGLLSFEPGAGATRRVAEGLGRLFSLPPDELAVLRERVRDHVATEWTWDRTAERLLDAAR
jgi:glycosyltransferase involved in cell wall biosynthesis